MANYHYQNYIDEAMGFDDKGGGGLAMEEFLWNEMCPEIYTANMIDDEECFDPAARDSACNSSSSIPTVGNTTLPQSIDSLTTEEEAFVDFRDEDLSSGLSEDISNFHANLSKARKRMSHDERRQRNNLSAKKSREAKKIKDRYRSITAKSLETENARLKLEIQMMEKQIQTIRQLLLRDHIFTVRSLLR
ncbi:uncharacterized protein TRIADDRAFT_53726 [Trichoplax adhaerens]|uniref:BZIP domain-containing protein n=1 Tax=Trichoplax adhaerens TaxID=10228 RepID=B3RPZ9_TRIAD|nr:hypothetical protein TRIADDRAFT_53726 [Trichoplax adhaerens]EDV27729.1 hypothetical protein TRIADDRAFT_53726 [Trichoplax adhaerens]|eukprot:XP_002109563.1 hypothetical protein TRIADDRAFT_53726 [Trichoplax adhaerens]